MEFTMTDDDDVLSLEMDFDGDATPTAMEAYRDNVISDRQQHILNQLRIDLCREDVAYLNDHKEVEAIATILLEDILKKTPKNPYAQAASFLRDPLTANRVANFTKPESFLHYDLIDRDAKFYSLGECTENEEE